MPVIDPVSAQQIQLRGFSRTIAELEWLLLLLVLLYDVAPGALVGNHLGIIIAMTAFAVFVLAFRYANFFTRETRWKLAVESWVMILFISYVSYHSGGVHSPLVNLYLLVIIASALTLGKLTTVLEFFLIASVYLYMGVSEYNATGFTIMGFSQLMTLFAPFLLVAYLTSMLAADVNQGMEMLRSLSETDELTGLNNRRAFTKLVNREAKKASRYGRPYSIMMLDTDNLKYVNDNHGHSAGDKLLKMVSESIDDTLRDSDIIARVGGDEFIIMLTDTDSTRAKDAAERIKRTICSTATVVEGNTITATVSIGIASYPDDSNDLNEIMKLADKSLYQSKKGGKNMVTVYQDIPEAVNN
jgi:diguanylate cyclase (GGDEF)-like protein